MWCVARGDTIQAPPRDGSQARRTASVRAQLHYGSAAYTTRWQETGWELREEERGRERTRGVPCVAPLACLWSRSYCREHTQHGQRVRKREMHPQHSYVRLRERQWLYRDCWFACPGSTKLSPQSRVKKSVSRPLNQRYTQRQAGAGWGKRRARIGRAVEAGPGNHLSVRRRCANLEGAWCWCVCAHWSARLEEGRTEDGRAKIHFGMRPLHSATLQP